MRRMLGQISTIRTGVTLRSAVERVPDGNVVIVQMKDIAATGQLDASDLYRIDLPNLKPGHLLQRCDILLKARGETYTAAAICEELPKAVAAPSLMVIRVDQKAADPQYVAWWINQRPAQKHLEQHATGSYQRLIKRRVVEELEIELPGLNVQERIVEMSALAYEEYWRAAELAELRKLRLDAVLMQMARSAPE